MQVRYVALKATRKRFRLLKKLLELLGIEILPLDHPQNEIGDLPGDEGPVIGIRSKYLGAGGP